MKNFVHSFYFSLVLIVVILFKVLFKKIIGDATAGQVSLFMTGLGLLNLLLNTLPVMMLAMSRIEVFWPAPRIWVLGIICTAVGKFFIVIVSIY